MEYCQDCTNEKACAAIKKYREAERNTARIAAKKEHLQFNVNPECYVAKEIFYQTALLQNILVELRKIRASAK